MLYLAAIPTLNAANAGLLKRTACYATAALTAGLVLLPLHAQQVPNWEWQKASAHMDWATWVAIDAFLDDPVQWAAMRRDVEGGFAIAYLCMRPDPVRLANVEVETWDLGEASNEDFDPVSRFIERVHGEQKPRWELRLTGEKEAMEAGPTGEVTIGTLKVRALDEIVELIGWWGAGESTWRIYSEESGDAGLSSLVEGADVAWIRVSVADQADRTYRISIGEGFAAAKAWVVDQCNHSASTQDLRKEWPPERLERYLRGRRSAELEVRQFEP